MNIRKLQQGKQFHYLAIPSYILRDFEWKKGDHIAIIIKARGVLEIRKVELPENNKEKKNHANNG